MAKDVRNSVKRIVRDRLTTPYACFWLDICHWHFCSVRRVLAGWLRSSKSAFRSSSSQNPDLADDSFGEARLLEKGRYQPTKWCFFTDRYLRQAFI